MPFRRVRPPPRASYLRIFSVPVWVLKRRFSTGRQTVGRGGGSAKKSLLFPKEKSLSESLWSQWAWRLL